MKLFLSKIITKHEDSIVEVTAIVLANLCVSYIMTSQNEKAEDLMRRIEREEEQIAIENPEKQCFHLCIVNLMWYRSIIYKILAPCIYFFYYKWIDRERHKQ